MARNVPDSTVQAYVARQDRYTARRRFMRWLIHSVGFRFLARAEITGVEHIPPTGPTILMMSHISLIDPVVCLGAVRDRFVIPMTKIENARHPLFGILVWGWGAYTVNRSEIDRSALTNSIELLKSGQMILIAPEGTRQKNGLSRPKNGMAYIATKANAVILPAAMSGTDTYLDRWKRLRRAEARVTFGPAFRFKTDGRAHIPRAELTRMTDEAMYQLALAQPDPAQRGVYSDLTQATTDYLEFVNTPAPDIPPA
jgi:1-acyl-sn-glycerol-3-phosphate acyltransferase